jgi:hypothetical protein
MLKAIKDAKRRAVEQVLYTVGASEKTTDLEYDDHVGAFHEMMADMNECGAGLSSVLTHTKVEILSHLLVFVDLTCDLDPHRVSIPMPVSLRQHYHACISGIAKFL